MIPTHNGPYIYACADKLGRELTKDEIVGALDCLAYEALQTVEKYQLALKEIAAQKLRKEMDDHTGENADWEDGYESCVKTARRSLDSENARCGGTAALDSQSEANEGCCPPLPPTPCSPS